MHWPFQAWAGSTMSLLRPSGPSWECWASSHRCITGNSCLCGAAVVAWAAQPGEPRLHQLQPLLFALFPTFTVHDAPQPPRSPREGRAAVECAAGGGHCVSAVLNACTCCSNTTGGGAWAGASAAAA